MFNLSNQNNIIKMFNWSTSAFKVIKSILAAKSDVSMPVAWYNSFLVAYFDKSNTNLTLSLIRLSGSG